MHELGDLPDDHDAGNGPIPHLRLKRRLATDARAFEAALAVVERDVRANDRSGVVLAAIAVA
jgi:hypothetical protein